MLRRRSSGTLRFESRPMVVPSLSSMPPPMKAASAAAVAAALPTAPRTSQSSTAAASATATAASTATPRRRRRRRLPPSAPRRVALVAVVAASAAALLAASSFFSLLLVSAAGAEGVLPPEAQPDPAAAKADLLPRAQIGGASARCSIKLNARDVGTSSIGSNEGCFSPPSDGSSGGGGGDDDDGTCHTATAAAASAATASTASGGDGPGEEGDGHDEDYEEEPDGGDYGDEEDDVDDEGNVLDEPEVDERRNWDADALGPYQDRSTHDRDAFLTAVRKGRAYLREYTMSRSIQDRPHFDNSSDKSNDEEDKARHKQCENDNVLCTAWALDGECDANPAYMKMHCPVACHSCEWLNATERCRPDPDGVDALRPGDLDAMMERIASDPDLVRRYSIEVISRPARSQRDRDDGTEQPAGAAANSNNNQGDDGMWLLVFHSFLSKEEADHMIRLGESTGYAASQVTVGFSNGQAVSSASQSRTSWNTWCSSECSHDPVNRRVVTRASEILRIDESNFEDTQLLRYRPGQYYKRHNDFIDAHLSLPMGPRILTLYVHLSDDVLGGGTRFPELNATVSPKAGRAVLWLSVRNDDPRAKDPRSDHEALPVEAGSRSVKYGANIWVHQQNFREALARSCA